MSPSMGLTHRLKTRLYSSASEPICETIPLLGLGTAQFGDENAMTQATQAALMCGIRLFDTAQNYGSEVSLGKALSQTDVERKELFLSCKVNYTCPRMGMG